MKARISTRTIEPAAWPPGQGEMAERIRAHDWAATPFGPLDGWPAGLKTVVEMMVASRFPMFVAWGPELAFIYNESYAEILGDKHPRALGSPFKDIWREIWGDIAPFIDSALAGKATWMEDLPLTMNRHGHDEETWFTFSYSPLRNDAGEIAGLYCACTETSRQVLASRALHGSEARLRIALDAGRMGVWTWDARTGETRWDEAQREIYGVPLDYGIDNDSFFALVHADDRAALEANIAEKIATLEPIEAEFRILRSDGAVRWVSVRSLSTAAADGGLAAMVGVTIDITDRNAAEAEVRDSEEQLQLISDSLTEYAIITTDRKGFVTSWTAGAVRLLGYSEEEAIGMDGRCIFTPEDRVKGEADRELETALRDGRAANERWHLRKDGSRFWGSGAVLRLRNGNGNGTSEPRLVKIMRDETARMRAEEHERVLLAELQHRVRNTLGLVRSIARRSAGTSGSVEELAAHLDGRLQAFARVQAVVTRHPGGGVDLAGLIDDELLAHAAREGAGIRISGPQVVLVAKSAETMSLALHELTTNAVKYGALVGDAGKLDIAWELADGQLHFRWKESGLAAIPEQPRREGFGFELLRAVVPYELHAESAVELRATGLCFTLCMPIEGNLSNR